MSEAAFAAAIIGWHDFYLAAAGASAALLGLLFVGVSINLGAIAAQERPDLRARAGLAFSNLIYVLIVVSVGGLGSIGGTLAAAMLLGVSDIAGKYYVPATGSILIYLVMTVLIMLRPAGIFGRR